MEKKSFAKNILGLFVTTNDNELISGSPSRKEAVTTPKGGNALSSERSSATLQQVPPVILPPLPSGSQQGEVDDKIAATLADALEKNNQTGFDYFEYAKTVDALKATIPAEATLYQSAFASATVMGASAQTLLQSAEFYLGILDKKAIEFEHACKEEYAVSVEGKIKEITGIEEQIRQKAELIQQITNEINTFSTNKNTLLSEVEQSKNKIEIVRKKYNTTWEVFSSRIRLDIEKIKQYLGT